MHIKNTNRKGQIIMYVFCFYDINDCQQHFETFESEQKFSEKHPGITPTYVFELNSDLNLSDAIQKSEFNKYAKQYGFDTDDYKAKLLTDGVHQETCTLIGFLPRNTKFKCQCIGEDGHHYKMTPKYVKEGIIRYNNAQKITF